MDMKTDGRTLLLCTIDNKCNWNDNQEIPSFFYYPPPTKYHPLPPSQSYASCGPLLHPLTFTSWLPQQVLCKEWISTTTGVGGREGITGQIR